jgi:hypothetical protein
MTAERKIDVASAILDQYFYPDEFTADLSRYTLK